MQSFRQNTALSNDTLMRMAPAIGATQPYINTSERFGFLNTLEMIEAVRDSGWLPVAVQTPHARTSKGKHYGRHVIRFRRESDVGLRGYEPNVGDVIPELVLFNAHDATTAFRFLAGLFRFICSNGLVVADSTFSSLYVRHTKHAIKQGRDAALQVLDSVPQLIATVDAWRAIELTSDQQSLFDSKAADLRGMTTIKPVPGALLRSRRYHDRRNDLWTVYNRVQENLVNGGVEGRDANNHYRNTRKIGDVKEVLRVNQGVWSLAEEFAKAA